MTFPPPWGYVGEGYTDPQYPHKVEFTGDGKPYAPIYYRMEGLIREYLATLDDDFEDETYCSARVLADGELVSFFEWLVINRKLDNA